MDFSPVELVIKVFEFVILLFSLSFHECAHAWMASRLGDQTARLQGRVSLNPIRHIDPVGTLLFPALMIFGGIPFLIGWAKPTPVITRNFKRIVRDDNLTTLAGPASNLILVVLCFVALVVLMVAVPGGKDAVYSAASFQINPSGETSLQAIALIAYLAIEVNLALMFFNLIPVPPLDGSHVLRNMLPYNAVVAYDRYGRYGFILIILLGRYFVGFFMNPAIGLVDAGLNLFLKG